MTIELRVAELLASKLCHDLVGPVGAINNGLELLAEEPGEMGEEALALISASAQRAAALLQIFRLSFGSAGYESGSELEELRRIAEAYVASEPRVTMDWQPESGAPLSRGVGKLLLNMILLAVELLPRGGEVVVRDQSVGQEKRLRVEAIGATPRLQEDHQAALAVQPEIEALTARGLQAYWTRLLAERLGDGLEIQRDPNGESLSVACRTTG